MDTTPDKIRGRWLAPLKKPRDDEFTGRPGLAAVIERIRQRWRLHLLLDGLFWTLACASAALLLAAWLVNAWHFAPGAVWALRAGFVMVLLALVYYCCIGPLRRRVDDLQVALYLEEREPNLRSIVLSAIDARRPDNRGLSAQLVASLEARALEACARIDYGDRIEAEKLRRAALRLGVMALVCVLLALSPPGFLRTGAPALLQAWASASEVSPYRIELAPGNIEIARGADQLITATIDGFDGDDVLLLTSGDGGVSWRSAAMTVVDEPGRYETFVFDVATDTDYYVTGAGRQTPIYRINVADIPAVDSIGLRYHFPAYTMLPPATLEDTGDISALRGTRVEVLIEPSIEIPGGSLELADGQRVDLRRGEDHWIGEITVQRDDSYRVILQRESGVPVETSPEYAVTALDDQHPRVAITSPGRDTRVSMIEEPVLKVRAHDDLGIASLELVLTIDGRQEQRIALMTPAPTPAAEQQVDVEHILYLEDLGLRPGDMISYYVSAEELAPATASRRAISDIFFYQVRPFSNNFRRAEQQGGGGGGGQQGGEQQGQLAEQQKQFVIATFKMIRDRLDFSEAAWQENLSLLETAQSRIRDRVEAIVRRIKSRMVILTDERYQVILDELPRAVEAMRSVEAQLGDAEIEAALTDAQIALGHLKRADAEFRDINVSLSNQGGGAARNAGVEDLANLFQLEMDKLRHQYDRVQHASPQAPGSEVIDETLEKLRELARRQQQELERQIRRQGQASNPGSSRDQLELAEQLEEMARQLERLSREQPNQQLQQSIRQMRNAAKAMRQAAANASANGSGAIAEARQAAENLREAQRLLDQSRVQQFSEDVERSLRRAELLERKQAEIRRQVAGLDTTRDSGFEARLDRIEQRKRKLSEELNELETELGGLLTEARDEQPRAGQSLQQALRSARENRLRDRIRRTRQMLRQDNRQLAEANETEIQKGFARIRENIESALANVDPESSRSRQQSIEQLRELARELRFMRERAASNSADRGGASAGGSSRVDADDGGLITPGELDNIVNRAREIGGGLRKHGVEAGDIDPVLASIEALQRNPEAAPVQAHDLALRALMELEYKLRDQLDRPEFPELLISEPAEVPDEYREMLADYYRNLGRE